MAIPSGGGTEVLKRGIVNATTTSSTSLLFTGLKTAAGASGNSVPTDHIVTMISMYFCNNTSSDCAMYLQLVGESITVDLFANEPIPKYSTFAVNDKFMLKSGDDLQVLLTGSGTVDLSYTFIDQDWT
tara:strand:+ start:28 stop:411 length:384 start_codon:yes stop_codon:yes gene_type:complete